MPSSRGARAEVKGRGLVLIPLIWAFAFWEPLSSPLRRRAQQRQQSPGVLLRRSRAAKQHLSNNEEESFMPVLRHDYG